MEELARKASNIVDGTVIYAINIDEFATMDIVFDHMGELQSMDATRWPESCPPDKGGMTNVQHCHTCDLLKRRDEGNAPLWDCIYRTPYWDVVHSYNTALPGWLVLVARRHIAAIAELT